MLQWFHNVIAMKFVNPHYYKVSGAKIAQIFRINRREAFSLWILLCIELTIFKHGVVPITCGKLLILPSAGMSLGRINTS